MTNGTQGRAHRTSEDIQVHEESPNVDHFLDAQYVINGLSANDKAYYRQGRNGDLWQDVYDEIEKLRANGISDINFIKVKSHVTTEDEWTRYNMTPEMLIYNELADEAARLASVKFGHSGSIKEDGWAKYRAQQVARRLAAIEVSTWTDEADFKKFEGKDFEKLREQRRDNLKRKAEAAFSNTSGGDGHSLYIDGKWHRCRDCPGFAHINNMKYWTGRECRRFRRKTQPSVMERWMEEAQCFNIATDSEDDESADEQPWGAGIDKERPASSSKESATHVSDAYFDLLVDMVEMGEDNIPVT